MFFPFNLDLRKCLWLFTGGILFGVTINFLSKSNDVKSRDVHFEEKRLNSTELFNEVKILCLVLTYEPNHRKKAIHVKNTWGSRCNKLIFVSNLTDIELGSVKLQKNDHHNILWGKIKRTLAYTYENFYNDFDWFFKADDDTYALLDNMRFMLSAYSPNDPIYFGNKFKGSKPLGFFHGGSGYVMSKTALKKFVTEALPDKHKCRPDDKGEEDYELGFCMHNVGVYPGDSRDQFQRERFNPFPPETHLFAFQHRLYWHFLYYPNPNREGLNSCSNSTISFHYVPPDLMYLLEYTVFNLQAYGVRHVYDLMPEKKIFNDVVQTLLAEVCATNTVVFN